MIVSKLSAGLLRAGRPACRSASPPPSRLRISTSLPMTRGNPDMAEFTTLSGKRIIVTGAARGIGASAARALAAAGATVTGVDVVDRAITTLQDEPGHALAHLICDVSSRSSTQSAFDAAVGEMGGLDVLIHAAGVQ